MGIRISTPVPASIAMGLFMALQDLIPEAEREAEERRASGNDEEWEELAAKVEYAQGALKAASSVIPAPLPADDPYLVAAITTLDALLATVGLKKLDAEQRYAMRDSFQAFDLLDDLEARVLGAPVEAVRILLGRACAAAWKAEKVTRSAPWSQADADLAAREGWLIALRDDGRAEIQRMDEADAFGSDEAAVSHVYAAAIKRLGDGVSLYSRAIASALDQSVKESRFDLSQTVAFMAVGAHAELGKLPLPESVCHSLGGLSGVIGEIKQHAGLLHRMTTEYWPYGCRVMYEYEICEPFGAALYRHIATEGAELTTETLVRIALKVFAES